MRMFRLSRRTGKFGVEPPCAVSIFIEKKIQNNRNRCAAISPLGSHCQTRRSIAFTAADDEKVCGCDTCCRLSSSSHRSNTKCLAHGFGWNLNLWLRRYANWSSQPAFLRIEFYGQVKVELLFSLRNKSAAVEDVTDSRRFVDRKLENAPHRQILKNRHQVAFSGFHFGTKSKQKRNNFHCVTRLMGRSFLFCVHSKSQRKGNERVYRPPSPAAPVYRPIFLLQTSTNGSLAAPICCIGPWSRRCSISLRPNNWLSQSLKSPELKGQSCAAITLLSLYSTSKLMAFFEYQLHSSLKWNVNHWPWPCQHCAR